MDLSFSAEEIAFRDEVRQFLAENLPEDLATTGSARTHLTKQDVLNWQRILFEQGWGAPGWPTQYGGPGWSPVQRHIFEEECAAAGAPPQLPFGLAMVGPVIQAFGSEEQKQRYLPRILSGEDWWCQGYSEPGSGSDLASLKTRAVRDGDEYVVDGQKIWTTQAQHADMIFCLVRTDTEVKQQEGISFLLIDMHSPGITVKPIISIDGAHSLNEVFFDGVRVPAENLIGEEGKGWTYAKFLLGHERTGIAGVGTSKKQIARLKEIAGAEMVDGHPLIDDAGFRDRISAAEIELTALEYTNLRVLVGAAQGKPPGPESSILKIKGTEIQQRINELLIEAIGYYAAAFPGQAQPGSNEPPVGPDYAAGLMEQHLYYRAATIYGGSNEIQKNIIAKMVLGL